jgi:hypothetical protein
MRQSERRNLWIVPLILVDVVIVVTVTLLFASRAIPLYPGAVIIYPILLVLNVLWILAWNRHSPEIYEALHRVPKSMWMVAAIFTPAGIAAVFAYVRNPTMPLGIQAVVAVLLVGYIWFIISSLRSHHSEKK